MYLGVQHQTPYRLRNKHNLSLVSQEDVFEKKSSIKSSRQTTVDIGKPLWKGKNIKILENMFILILSLNRIYHDYSIPRVPECLFHRRNYGSPTPSPSSLGSKGGGGGTLSCGWRGTQLGRLDRKPGTEFSVGSNVHRKMRSSVTRQQFVGTPCIVYGFSFLRIQLGDIHTFW
jgi:hypothetical protein